MSDAPSGAHAATFSGPWSLHIDLYARPVNSHYYPPLSFIMSVMKTGGHPVMIDQSDHDEMGHHPRLLTFSTEASPITPSCTLLRCSPRQYSLTSQLGGASLRCQVWK